MPTAGPHHIKVHRIDAQSLRAENAIRFCREDSGKRICTFFKQAPQHVLIDGNATGDELASVITELAALIFGTKTARDVPLYTDSIGVVTVSSNP